MAESYSVEAVLSLVDSGFTAGIAQASKQVKTLANDTVGSVGEMGKTMMKTGAYMSAGITAPLAAMGKSIFTTGQEFDSTFNAVKAVSEETGVSFEDLRKQAIKLGADSIFGATDVASAMEMMGSAGFGTKEIFDSMPGVIDLAAASGGNMALAAEVAATALNQFNLDMTQTGHVADVFAQAAAATNAEISDMGEAMKYAGPVAGSLGISLEETAAAIGIMSNAGIKGSQAGTTLRGALTRLSAPTKKARLLMEDWGWSAFDASGKMKPLNQIIPELRSEMADMTDQQKQQAITTLFGQNAMSGMLALINSAPGEFDSLTQSLIQSDGAAQKMADTLMEGLPGAWETLGGSIESAQLELYDLIQGPLAEIVTRVADVIDAFSELSDAQQMQILKWAGMAAAVGPVLTIMGGFVSMAATVAGGMMSFAGAIASVGTGFIGLATSSIGAVGSLGVVQGVMGTLGTTFTAFFNGLFPKLGTLMASFTNIGLSATAGTSRAIAALAQLGLAIVGPVAAIGVFAAAVGLLGTAFYDEIMGMINLATTQGPTIISNLANGIISALPQLMATGINIITGLANALAANIPTIIQKGVEIIVALVQGVQAGLPQIISAAINVVTSLVTSLISAVPQLMVAGMQFVLALVQGLIQAGPQLLASAQQMVSTFQNGLNIALPVVIQTGIQIILSLIQGITSSLPNILTLGVQLITSFVQALMSNLPQVIAGGVQIVSALIQAIAAAIPNIISSAGEIISSLVRGIISNLPEIMIAGAKIVFELIKGLISAIPAINSAVIDLMASIGKAIFDGIMDLGGKIGDWWGNNMPKWLGGGAKEASNAVTTEFKGMADESTSIMDSMSASLESSMQEITAGMQSNAAQAANSVPGEFQAMEFNVEEIFNNLDTNIISSMQNIKGGTVAAANTTTQGVTTAFQPIGTQGVIPYNQMVANIQGSMQGLSTTVPGMALTTANGVVQSSQQVALAGQNFHQFGNDATTAMSNMALQVPNLAMQASTGVIDSANALNLAANPFEDFKNGATNAMSLMATTVPGLASQATSAVQANTSQVGTFADFYSQLSSGAQAYLGEYDAVVNLMTAETANKAFANTGEVMSMVDWYNQLPSWTQASLAEYGVTVDSLTAQTAQTAVANSQQVENAVTPYQNFANGATSAMQGLTPASDAAGQTATDVNARSQEVENAKAHYEALRDASISAMNLMKAQIKIAYTLIAQDANSSSRTMKSDVTSNFESMSSDVKSKMNSMKSAMQNGFNAMKANASSMMSSMQSVVSSGMSNVVSRVRSSMSSAVSAMNAAAGQARSAGYNMGAGFYGGLSSMAGSIIGLARSIANSAAAAMRSALRIHSPSKVTEEIGEFTGEGQIVGMENKLKAVKQMATKLANAAVMEAPRVAKVAQTAISNRRFADVDSSGLTTNTAPTRITLVMGGHEWTTHVNDITKTQQAELRLSY
ncbi:phage tail tape measure protein [Facklamia sp. P13069]|uniref:phage tail tape measure protein n=1 Tax=Facklamia sp. P13069 TaxID=3421954 RepID=UPI003D176B37